MSQVEHQAGVYCGVCSLKLLVVIQHLSDGVTPALNSPEPIKKIIHFGKESYSGVRVSYPKRQCNDHSEGSNLNCSYYLINSLLPMYTVYMYIDNDWFHCVFRAARKSFLEVLNCPQGLCKTNELFSANKRLKPNVFFSFSCPRKYYIDSYSFITTFALAIIDQGYYKLLFNKL